MDVTIEQRDGTLLAAKFRRFAEINGRKMAYLVRDQSRRLATDLYVAAADAAPSEEQIKADVERQGWRIPARFSDGRLGRGVPKNWLGAAWDAKKPKRKRGRPKKGETAALEAQEAVFMQQRPTLAMMQLFVEKIRNAARLFIASGYLGAVEALGGSLKGTSRSVLKTQPKRGYAIIQLAGSNPSVTIVNDTTGVITANRKHGFVTTAISARIKSMDEYIRSHTQETWREAA